MTTSIRKAQQHSSVCEGRYHGVDDYKTKAWCELLYTGVLFAVLLVFKYAPKANLRPFSFTAGAVSHRQASGPSGGSNRAVGAIKPMKMAEAGFKKQSNEICKKCVHGNMTRGT